MRFVLVFALAGVLGAQSNPSWWKYTPPGATAVVGIHWDNLRQTMFASAIASEFAADGSLGFPDMEILRNPEQMLIASPVLLAVEYGDFPVAAVRQQAASKGMNKSSFKGVELWLAADTGSMGVALISPKVLLVGSMGALQDAIARGSAIDSKKSRGFSPLLARGARYSEEDLWVVASQLPDPLASKFLPLELQATAFEGSVSMWDGLHLVAAIERPSPTKALDLADALVESLATRPTMAEAMEVSTQDRSVLIKMDLDEAQFLASLRTEEAPVPTAEVPTVVAPVHGKTQPRAFVPPDSVKGPPPPRPVEPAILASPAPELEVIAPSAIANLVPSSLPPPPARPKVVRIFGLGDGPIEIPLGPAPPRF